MKKIKLMEHSRNDIWISKRGFPIDIQTNPFVDFAKEIYILINNHGKRSLSTSEVLKLRVLNKYLNEFKFDRLIATIERTTGEWTPVHIDVINRIRDDDLSNALRSLALLDITEHAEHVPHDATIRELGSSLTYEINDSYLPSPITMTCGVLSPCKTFNDHKILLKVAYMMYE